MLGAQRNWYAGSVGSMGSAYGAPSARRLLGQQSPFSETRQRLGTNFGGLYGQGNRQRFGMGNPLQMFENNSRMRMEKMFGNMDQGFGMSPGGTAAPGSLGTASPSPSFSGGNLDSATGDINSAAYAHGVPANLLKAVIAHESSGNWARDGNRYVYLSSRGHNILPYVGITDPAARAWGASNPRSLIGDRRGQIDLLARGLARLYHQNPQYGWKGVVNTHYSGDPTGRKTPGDSWQYGSTNQYTGRVMSWWNMLDGGQRQYGAPGQGMNGAPGISGGTAGGMSMIWGNRQASISQEMGLNDFSKNHLGGMYKYGYGLGVVGHPGIDIHMPYGSALFSPVNGRVIIAGNSSHFRNGPGGGGELRIQDAQGNLHILGHMASIGLRPGDSVRAGQQVGTSGSSGSVGDGDHLHLEVRVRGNTSTGWKAVDPKSFYGGGVGGYAGGAAGFQGAPMQQPSGGGMWFRNSLDAILGNSA